MSETQHTPTPWRSTGDECEGDGNAGIGIGSENGCMVAFVTNWNAHSRSKRFVSVEDEANAEFIVRACNCYDDLRAACEDAAEALEQFSLADKQDCGIDEDSGDTAFGLVCLEELTLNIRQQLRAAIARAKPG